MRKIQSAALVCAMLAATSAFAQSSQSAKPAMAPKMAAEKSPVADALMKKEEAMLASLAKKDFATFRKMVMPGTWAVDENGAMSIEDFLKTVADPKAGFSFEYKASDMKVVTVDANSAIVMYKLDEKGSMMGQPFPPVVYVSTTWANHGGNWMAVFHQESTAAAKK